MATRDARTHVGTQQELADALGLTAGAISAMKRKPWFPEKGASGWDVEEVRRLWQGNTRTWARGRRQAVAAERFAGETVPPVPTLDEATTGASLEDLTSDDPLDRARAAVKLAADRLALESQAQGGATRQAFESLKGALGELRLQEKARLDLEERRGDLIRKDVAAQVAAGLARRLVRVLDNVEALVAAQVEIWAGSEEWRAKNTEDRQREVRQWFAKEARHARAIEAEELDSLLGEE